MQSTRVERRRLQRSIEVSSLLAFYPNHLVSKFPEPCCQTFLTVAPPRSLGRHEYERARSQSPAKTLFPIPRVHDLRGYAHTAFVRQIPKPARQMPGIHRWLVQRNSVRNDVNIHQSDAGIEISRQSF